MGISIEDYAEALFQRERVLDMDHVVVKEVSKGFFKKRVETVVEGSLENAWSSLEGYAKNHSVPFVPGDLERTNRLPELEQRIQREPAARAEFRKAYAATLARHLLQSSRHLPLSGQTLAKAQELEQDETYMANPLVPMVQRKPGLIERLESQRAQMLAQASSAVRSGQSDPDPVLFPGQRPERLSDLVRIQKDLQTSGDMMGALARAGVEPAAYGQIMIQWAQMLGNDTALQAKYAMMMSGGAVGSIHAN